MSRQRRPGLLLILKFVRVAPQFSSVRVEFSETLLVMRLSSRLRYSSGVRPLSAKSVSRFLLRSRLVRFWHPSIVMPVSDDSRTSSSVRFPFILSVGPSTVPLICRWPAHAVGSMVWGLKLPSPKSTMTGIVADVTFTCILMSVPVSASVVIVMTPCACVANVAPSRAMAVSSLFISF